MPKYTTYPPTSRQQKRPQTDFRELCWRVRSESESGEKNERVRWFLGRGDIRWSSNSKTALVECPPFAPLPCPALLQRVVVDDDCSFTVRHRPIGGRAHPRDASIWFVCGCCCPVFLTHPQDFWIMPWEVPAREA